MTEYTELNLEALQRLYAPFENRELDFRDEPKRSFAYVAKNAVRARLNQVDPKWQWKIVEFRETAKTVMCFGVLTVLGVERVGCGEAVNAGAFEAFKGATTDAFRRAAKEFGVGAYLDDCPVSTPSNGHAAHFRWNEQEIARWRQDPALFVVGVTPTRVSGEVDAEYHQDVFQRVVEEEGGTMVRVLPSPKAADPNDPVLKQKRQMVDGLIQDELLPKDDTARSKEMAIYVERMNSRGATWEALGAQEFRNQLLQEILADHPERGGVPF